MNAEDALAMSDDQLDRLANLIAVRVASAKGRVKAMLTVEDVCEMFQVSRAWVYENAGRLGGFKLGPGERAPLRFDPALVQGALMPLAQPTAPTEKRPAEPKSRKRAARLHPVYDG